MSSACEADLFVVLCVVSCVMLCVVSCVMLCVVSCGMLCFLVHTLCYVIKRLIFYSWSYALNECRLFHHSFLTSMEDSHKTPLQVSA